MLFRTRRRDEYLRLKEGVGRRARKSRQKEAAGAVDAGLMQIEWGKRGVLKAGRGVKASGGGERRRAPRRVAVRSDPARRREEVWSGDGDTLRRDALTRADSAVCGRVISFMQPWPGAVENGVGVVPQ